MPPKRTAAIRSRAATRQPKGAKGSAPRVGGAHGTPSGTQSCTPGSSSAPYGTRGASRKKDGSGVRPGGSGSHAEVPSVQKVHEAPVDNTAILQGISQTLVQLSERMEQLGARAARPEQPRQPRSRACRRQRSPVESEASSASGDDQARSPARAKKRHAKHRRTSRSAHTRVRTDSSSSSGECTSDEDTVHADGNYWRAGALVPGLPAWLHKRRAKGEQDSSSVWVSEESQGALPPSQYSDIDDPPGIHLLRKLRERVLDGYYVDIFSLLKPEGEAGKTGPGQEKKRGSKGSPERSFQNWLKGYTVYMSLVAAAYPERGWHLANHLGNVLKARSMASDAPAMDYDEEFRKKASHNELTSIFGFF
ncbi:UNVERIFIED_CONTAM: hypothetical protein K2H54_068173 [Gekko kuhli]